MLILLHVAQDEAQRVAAFELVVRLLEADGGVLHLFDAPCVLGSSFRKEVRLESAPAARIVRVEWCGIYVNRDEQIARRTIGDASAVVERDQGIGRPRVDDIDTT